MILTMVFNPRLIRKIEVTSLKDKSVGDERVATVEKEKLYINDSGIYTALIIKMLQAEPYIIGFSGGIGGRFIKNFLDKNRIKSDLIQLTDEAKVTTLLTDQCTGCSYRLESNGLMLESNHWKNLKHKYHNHVKQSEVVIFSDDLPLEITENRQARPRLLLEEHQKLIIRLKGSYLALAEQYHPYAIIADPYHLNFFDDNQENEVLKSWPPDSKTFERLRLWMSQQQIKQFYLATEGKIYGISKNKIGYVTYQQADRNEMLVDSAIMGAVAIGAKRNYTFEKVLKLAGAIAQKINMDRFPRVIHRHDIDTNLNKVKVQEIYNRRQGYMMEADD